MYLWKYVIPIIKATSAFTVGYLTSHLVFLYFDNIPKAVKGKSEARFLIQCLRSTDPCILHILQKKPCVKDCRYSFMLWLISCIDEAKSHVDMAIYFLNEESIADALIRAKQRGVEVRILASHTEEDSGAMGSTLLTLRRAYIKVHSMKTPSSQLMHQKLIIVDHERVLIGSMNFTKSAFESNSEEILHLSDPESAHFWSSYFQQCWNCISKNNVFFGRIRELAREAVMATKTDKVRAQAKIEDLVNW